MNTKTVEDGMSDEKAVRQVYTDASAVLAGPRNLTQGWYILSFQNMPSTGYHATPELAWADARSHLPKPEDGIEAQQRVLAINGDMICRAYSEPTEWSVVDSDTGEAWGHSEDSEGEAWTNALHELTKLPVHKQFHAPKLELKGEGGALESPEELPPLHTMASIQKEHKEFEDAERARGVLWKEIPALTDWVLQRLWKAEAENKRLRPSAAVPVDSLELPPLDLIDSDYERACEDGWVNQEPKLLAILACRERQLKQCMSPKNQLTHTVANLSGKIAKLSHESLSRDVPVEERTAEEFPHELICPCYAFMGCSRECKSCICSVQERTAEMEQLMGLLEEYRESHTNSRRPCVDETLGGISTSSDSRCSTCKSADEILDHIEGKAK
jgi:hypothetical protein